MAGPFGRTSDTTTAVSPVSKLGLSLPPDKAKPKPKLGSFKKKKKKEEWYQQKMTNRGGVRQRQQRMEKNMQRDRGRQSTFQRQSQSELLDSAGCAALNSCCETEMAGPPEPQKILHNNLRNNTEKAPEPVTNQTVLTFNTKQTKHVLFLFI